MSRWAAAAALALLLPAVLGLSACAAGQADDAADDGEPSTSQPSSDKPSSDKPSTKQSNTAKPKPDKPSTDDAVVVDIVVAGGDVTPAGKQVEVRVGQRVELRVDSDAADELHVHSAPEEQEFEVRAAANQTFELVPEQPGQFDIELHQSGTLVAQLVARP
ncbi:hypothetical protein BH20ACT6_BH20ACT6_16000 [soil metagenome]